MRLQVLKRCLKGRVTMPSIMRGLIGITARSSVCVSQTEFTPLSCANNVYDTASLLLRKLLEANCQSELHAEQFTTFCESLSADTLSKWEEMAVLWEDDPKNPCPYVAESSRESVTCG